jgi:hypothetical protein
MESTNNSTIASAVLTAALALRVDSVTAKVVREMRRVGIRPLLLKGPSFTVWLYGDGTGRRYGDTDLLVAPGSYGDAGEVLHELGFRSRAYSWEPDSQAWMRPVDASYVDLHRSLIGASAPPEIVWHELAADTDALPVGGIDVEVLRVPARALHAALHAAQHGEPDAGQTRSDLARALRATDEGTWRTAAGMARRIGAMPAFAAGLRLNPDGARLAERLELPTERPPAAVLRAQSEIPVAFALEVLASRRTLRARVLLFLRSIIPPRLYMRQWSAKHMSSWPTAVRRGLHGLVLAYLWRPIWILLRLPHAITALRRARRSQP